MPGEVSRALVDAELERLAATAAFRRSVRHLRLLRHLVECTLRGERGRLREMALGVDIFQRSAERFDPRRDSIVRVEVRRLRQKLERYYDDEGAEARLHFLLTPGRYEVTFLRPNGLPAARRSRVSVAVFDIDPGSPVEPARASFAAGLSHDLTGALTRLNGLRVVAAGAAPPETGPGPSVAAAEALAAGAAVIGRLLPRGRRASLAIRLVRVADSATLWSADEPIAPATAAPVVERFARAIIARLHRERTSRMLHIRLGGRPPLVRTAAEDDVRELIDLARIGLLQHRMDGYRRALALAEEAVAKAPSCAPSHLILAQALIALVGVTALPSVPSMEAARKAALRAAELDPELADAHGELGFILFSFDRDWAAAEAQLLRALRLAPAQARMHARYGFALMMHRRFVEARAAYDEAIDLDPLSLLYRAHRALVDIYAGDYGGARAALDQVLALEPQHLVAAALRAALHLYEGDAHAALQAYRELGARVPGLTIGACGRAQAHAMLGDHEAARSELRHLLEAFEAGSGSPYQIAMVHARLAQPDEALRWLRCAADLREYNFVCAAVDPVFASLRDAGPLQALLDRNGFAQLRSDSAGP